MPVRFNPSDPLSVQFVSQAQRLLSKIMFGTTVVAVHEHDVNLPSTTAEQGFSVDDAVASVQSLLEKHDSSAQWSETLRDALDKLRPEEFDKDRQSLGHVSFVAAAANLRARAYGLRECSELEVQRVAGNIIPALGTTTALVAGLVSLELVKIATERIRARQTGVMGAGAIRSRDRVRAPKKKKSFFGRIFLKSSLAASTDQTATRSSPPVSAAEKVRLLARFRNSFVNLATPMLAHSEPAPADTFQVRTMDGETESFTSWDRLDVSGDFATLTARDLLSALQTRFDLQELLSVHLGDLLLYLDLSAQGEADLDVTLAELLVRSVVAEAVDSDVDDDLEDATVQPDSELSPAQLSLATYYAGMLQHSEAMQIDGAAAPLRVLDAVKKRFHSISDRLARLTGRSQYVELSVVCKKYSEEDGQYDAAETDVRLPVVRVKVGAN